MFSRYFADHFDFLAVEALARLVANLRTILTFLVTETLAGFNKSFY